MFSDANYTQSLVMPELGIELRTNVYVEVKATNLTGQYHVLLDRCYASISTEPSNSSYFNLIVPCSKDQFTTIVENGDSQSTRFHFPAFRFIEQQNETVSTYYLHRITRLCEKSTCSSFKQCNNRRKRNAVSASSSNMYKTYTLSSAKIVTNTESNKSNSAVGHGAPGGVVLFACVLALRAAAVWTRLSNYGGTKA